MEAKPKDNVIPNFSGLRVLALESRMALPMERLIQKYGGSPQIAPSLKEVPLEDNTAAFDFFAELRKGHCDLLILMTGVGLRTLLKILETRFSKEEILEAFAKTQIVVRGPKPSSVCKMYGIPIAISVPAPNTWTEILQILKEEKLLQGKRVTVLEYGRSDVHFLAELQSQGAVLQPLPVYQWALPDDTGPLRQAVVDIIAGKIDILLQTSAIQIDHLLKMVQDKFEELKLRRALAKVLVVSIGPATSAHLEELQIFPDLEASPHKMDNLVECAARLGPDRLAQKRRRAEESWTRVESSPFSPAESQAITQASPMWRACHRLPVDRTPVWLMRQAGRYMTEYQLIRHGMDFLKFCKRPELCIEATLSAVERLNVDAAIIFSDILLILEAMGLPLAFREGSGPVISAPLRSAEDILRLKPVNPREDLPFLFESIRGVRSHLHPRIPLIGFSGAPFTLASYMIEGKGSRNYIPTKTLMHTEPQAWHDLMTRLTVAVTDYLIAQVEEGCDILQVFDSWVGCLSPQDYQEFVLPYTQAVFAALPANVPTIHFGTGTATLLPLQQQAGGNVIGLDWRMDIPSTWDQLGDVAVQGNFDPVLLFSSLEVIRKEAARILTSVGSRPGFIFNLGHGILPETPVDHVMALVDFVHEWKL